MTSPSSIPDQVTWRFRLVACSLVLIAVAFSQRPGRISGDTKLDLVVNPAGLLGRALHLWDPQGGFGQVQNQAYGYLFPMGSFHLLGDLLSMPGWVVQRLWWSLLLVVAFLGVVKLAGALGLGSPVSRIIAGFAYALSPRILTLLGPISIEAWPSALAPWVLVPLVIGSSRGSPRVAALRSALAVAAVGGVNAVATFAVIPLGALWLLTRERGARRRSMMAWWPLFVLVGTAWWLVPLLLLGKYSPPFLDFIETASVTTFPTSMFDALRGTSHWVPYVDSTWQAGNDLITTGYVALNSGVLLLFGVAGVAVARNPHRQFLTVAVFAGLLAVTAGHGGAMQGWFGAAEREALDGALAPFRNVHKFDPLIRVPLVLGLAHVLAVLGARVAELRRAAASGTAARADFLGSRMYYTSALIMCVVSVAGTASPALAGRLAAWNDFESIPDHWSQTAEWLGENSGETTALLVPGSNFGYYTWGDPDDEPLQPLATSPWAVRNAIPLAPAGNLRMLDAIETRLASGRPSSGLAGYLRRAGIGHLVVRNDLRSGDQPDPVVVHQVLDGSPGLERVARFGPLQGSPARLSDDFSDTVVNWGLSARYPAVEIYEVADAHRAVVASGSPLVVGGPEDLLDLADAGLLGDAPAVLAVDATDNSDRAGLLLTDGLRRREANFARTHAGKSATLGADANGRRGAPAREYTLGDGRWETVARIVGARSVSASSSRAFADTPAEVLPETQPFAAFDGLVDTAWRSGPPDGSLPWVRIEFESPRVVRQVVVQVAGEPGDEDATRRLRVETDTGASREVEAQAGEFVTIPLPAGLTSGLRIRGADPYRELEMAEISVPGVDVDRTLELPEVPARWGAPSAILLSATDGWRDACVEVDSDVRCAVGRSQVGEDAGAIDRTIRVGEGAAYGVAVTATPVNGDALQGLIQRGQLANVRASTTAVDDARASAIAAVDGATGTTWIAESDDPEPTLSVDWLGERTVRSIQLSLDLDAAASRPTRVKLTYPGGSQSVELDKHGSGRVEEFRSSRVDIEVTKVEKTRNFLANGAFAPTGVGVSELRLGGLGLLPLRLSKTPRDLGCEFGPPLRVGDAFYPTSVIASPRDLFDGEMLPARVCGPAEMGVPAGSTRVVLSPSPAFRGVRVVMQSQVLGPIEVQPAPLDSRSQVHRELEVPSMDEARIAVVRENQNEGWVADVPGPGSATRITVDGWQQGWRLEGDVDRVELSFAPDGLYRGALAGGGLLLALLAAAGLWLRRRPGGQPSVTARWIPSGLLTVLGLLALGLMGGWTALACGAGAIVASAVVRPGVRCDVVAWTSGGLVGLAALFYWYRPLGSADGWAGAMAAPQLLVAAALGLLLSTDLLLPGNRTSFKRMVGRSTSR